MKVFEILYDAAVETPVEVENEYQDSITELLKHFKEILSEPDYKKLDELLTMNAEHISAEAQERFEQGIRIGFQLAAELNKK